MGAPGTDTVESVGTPGATSEERIVARAWPAAENRIAVAELTF